MSKHLSRQPAFVGMDAPWMELAFRTRVPQPLPVVVRHFDSRLMLFLSPPFPRLSLRRYEGNLPGNRVEVALGFGFFTWTWAVEITEARDSEREHVFVDEGRRLPPFLSAWRHEHRLEAVGPGETDIVDRLWFRAGKGWPDFVVRLMVALPFRQRGPGYRRFFSQGVK